MLRSTLPALPAAPFALFDDSSSPPHEARSLLLHGLKDTIVCSDAQGVDTALARIDAAAAAGRHVAIVADYELGYWLEAKLLTTPYAGTRPLLHAYVFGGAETLDGSVVAQMLADHQAALLPRQRICGIADLRRTLDEGDYLAAIQRILAYIQAGDCYQVNYTFALSLRHFGDLLALYARLRQAQPVRHGAYLRLPQRTLLSLSPELFVERRGGRLITRPMKGTAARGSDPRADVANRDAMAASEKNRAENVMIVDLIRNDLGRIAHIGSVHVERMFDIEAFPTLWQMTSTVTAEVPALPLASIFRALFPCGSVTGAPKFRAMQIAAELEPGTRGIYTGAIGYLLPGGDFSFNVPIRTLALDADGSGTLGVGSGIVADSDAHDELAECLLKARFVTDLDADFQLIETLLLDPADRHVFPLLDDHLQRLCGSARYFSFKCDAARVGAALLAHARTLAPSRHYRTRLLLYKSGEVTIESANFETDAAAGELQVVFAASRIDSGDLFRYHKTTVRSEYEAELARLKSMPEVFDALFCNERGELCEGARSNVFLSFGGVLHTPPTSAGLLNGIMRRKLLRENGAAIVERTLYPEDAARADAIFISNAVRGLQRVRLRLA